MGYKEEKAKIETLFQRELTDVEFAETLLEKIKRLEDDIEANEMAYEDLANRLEEATKTDEWDDIRNKVEEILTMPGDYHRVTVTFKNRGEITMDFAVDGLPIRSTTETWEGEF